MMEPSDRLESWKEIAAYLGRGQEPGLGRSGPRQLDATRRVGVQPAVGHGGVQDQRQHPVALPDAARRQPGAVQERYPGLHVAGRIWLIRHAPNGGWTWTARMLR